MSAYRDRPVQCPRCKRDLIRAEAKDVWKCDPCGGLLVGTGELIDLLARAAPALVPDGGAKQISTLGRRTTQPTLDCAICAAPMEPVFLGGVEVDRCRHDEMFWLDRSELMIVIDRALELAQDRGWFAWLREWLAP